MVHSGDQRKKESSQQNFNQRPSKGLAGDSGGYDQGMAGESAQSTRGNEKHCLKRVRQVGSTICDTDKEQSTEEKEGLVRRTFFLSQSVIDWLEFWADRHGMRSPSKFLNELLKRMMSDHEV